MLTSLEYLMTAAIVYQRSRDQARYRTLFAYLLGWNPTTQNNNQIDVCQVKAEARRRVRGLGCNAKASSDFLARYLVRQAIRRFDESIVTGSFVEILKLLGMCDIVQQFRERWGSVPPPWRLFIGGWKDVRIPCACLYWNSAENNYLDVAGVRQSMT